MILHIQAKIKALNWKPDAESVLQLEANLEPSEVQQLAAFGARMIQVQLTHQEIYSQRDMFAGADGDGSLTTRPMSEDGKCRQCGALLEDLICHECGQEHLSVMVFPPELVQCGEPALYLATINGDQMHLCQTCLDEADAAHSAELDQPQEDATCEFKVRRKLEVPAEDAPEVCLCGHDLNLHGLPGQLCRGTSEPGDVCDCRFFRSAVEMADEAVEAVVAEVS